MEAAPAPRGPNMRWAFAVLGKRRFPGNPLLCKPRTRGHSRHSLPALLAAAVSAA
jgi:hypothetical protein